VLQRDVALAGVLGIVERQVALAESAAAGILAAQAHRRPFEHQRAEGQRLAAKPSRWVRPFARGVAALFDEPPQLGMQVEIRAGNW
jgi:hypothetical protein